MKILEIIKKTFNYLGHYDVAELLIRNDAIVNAKTNDKSTALICAASNGNFEIKNQKKEQNFCFGVIQTNIYSFRSSRRT